MRIHKSWESSIATRIVENLIKKDLIEPTIPLNSLIEETEKLLMDELTVEDRLNDEVHQLLRKYESEIEKGRLDFKKIFDMTKQKMVKERNIVL